MVGSVSMARLASGDVGGAGNGSGDRGEVGANARNCSARSGVLEIWTPELSEFNPTFKALFAEMRQECQR